MPRITRSLIQTGSLAAALALSACSNPSPSQPTASPSKTARVPASPTVAPAKHYKAFDITGSFPGALVSHTDDLALTIGSPNSGLGDHLTGLTLFSPDGTQLAASDPSLAPCAETLVPGTDPAIVYAEAKSLPAEGLKKAGTQITVTVTDASFKTRKTITLPEYRGEPHELWHDDNRPDHGKCEVTTTGDGKYALTFDDQGFWAINLTTFAVTKVIDHYRSAEDALPAGVRAMGSDLLVFPSRKMLAPIQVSVIDPATMKPVKKYAAMKTTTSQLAHLLDDVADDGDGTAIPDAPASAYYWAFLTDDHGSLSNPHPVLFDLTKGTMTPVGPSNLNATAEPWGGQLWFERNDDIGGSKKTLLGYDAAGKKQTLQVPGVMNICAASGGQIAVNVNNQLAILDATTGRQIAFNGDVASTGIMGGSACARDTVGGFGWDIADDAINGNGGQIVSYFDQDAPTQ